MKNNDTKNKILDYTLELLQTRGVNGFSFAHIAEKIKIKKASIHYYFPSKNDLIKEALNTYSNDFFENLNKETKNNPGIKEELIIYIGKYRKNLENNKVCPFISLSVDYSVLPEEILNIVNEYLKNNLLWIKNSFSKYDYQNEKINITINSFFSTIQGAQILSRSFNDIKYFDDVLNNKLNEILYIINYI